MKATTLNTLFFVAGLIGTPFCIYGWQRWHRVPWLLGIGIFAYFIVSSITEALMQRRNKNRR